MKLGKLEINRIGKKANMVWLPIFRRKLASRTFLAVGFLKIFLVYSKKLPSELSSKFSSSTEISISLYVEDSENYPLFGSFMKANMISPVRTPNALMILYRDCQPSIVIKMIDREPKPSARFPALAIRVFAMVLFSAGNASVTRETASGSMTELSPP